MGYSLDATNTEIREIIIRARLGRESGQGMINFKRFVIEAYDATKILTNPSKTQTNTALKHSNYNTLRYVHNTQTNQTHVSDGEHHDHLGIAQHAGETEFTGKHVIGDHDAYNSDHFHAGIIDKNNINDVQKHPKGLKGYIHDVHQKLHDYAQKHGYE